MIGTVSSPPPAPQVTFQIEDGLAYRSTEIGGQDVFVESEPV